MYLYICFFIFFWLENGYVTLISPSQPIIVDKKNQTQFIIYLIPADGVHINGDPAPTFTILSEKSPIDVQLIKSPPAEKKDNFSILDHQAPFIFKIYVKESFTNREEKLQAIYYYCSDTEGWCKREIKEFAIQLKLK